MVSALFLWPSHFYSFVSQVCQCCCPPFSAGVRPFPLAMWHFYSFVSQVCHCSFPPFSAGHVPFLFNCVQVCHCWCPPFSAGHVAFLFICLPGLSLLVSALFRWRSISILLSLSLALLVSALFCWPCSIICVPSLSLLVSLVSALFRWPCSISIHLSPRSVTAGVRPFPLAMYIAILFICLSGLSLLASALFRWPCSTSIYLSPRPVTADVCFFLRAGVRPFPLAM